MALKLLLLHRDTLQSCLVMHTKLNDLKKCNHQSIVFIQFESNFCSEKQISSQSDNEYQKKIRKIKTLRSNILYKTTKEYFNKFGNGGLLFAHLKTKMIQCVMRTFYL